MGIIGKCVKNKFIKKDNKIWIQKNMKRIYMGFNTVYYQ